MKKLLAAAAIVMVGLVACADEPRDLDAYVCGDDETKSAEVVMAADCIEVYDETNADEGDRGTFIGRFERVDG